MTILVFLGRRRFESAARQIAAYRTQGLGDIAGMIACNYLFLSMLEVLALERAETVAAIRRGMKDAEEGRMMPVEETVTKLEAKHGL